MSYKKQVLDLTKAVQKLARSEERDKQKIDNLLQEIGRLKFKIREKDKEFKAIKFRKGAQVGRVTRKKVRSPAGSASSHGCVSSPGSPASSSHFVPAVGKSNNNELEEECERMAGIIACQEEDLHKAASEIEVLACALEQRAEDLEVDGSLETGLLYQVGFFQKETHRLEKELIKLGNLEDKHKQEKAALENEKKRLEETLMSVRNHSNELVEERSVILDYIKEHAKKEGNLEERVEELSSENEELKEQTRSALEAEQQARYQLDQLVQAMHEQGAYRGTTNHGVGDPLFEKMLRETQAEIKLGTITKEREDLLETIEQLKDKVKKLELRVIDEKAAASSAEGKLETMVVNKDKTEARLRVQIETLQADIRKLKLQKSEDSSSEDVSGNEKDLLFRHKRLQTLLSVSNEARDIAEREAVRLEVENMRLTRQLRKFET
mmetsp:Transcript_8135/g.14993  ORF Transcript_8135/g.14993 Transcript_8135/m.14993 type:complete len:437 (+) Transcript_8135:203-1513(+)